MLASVVLAVLLSSTQVPASVGHDRLDVESVLVAGLPSWQACNGSGFFGSATFDFSITEAGTVANVVHVSHVENSSLATIASCLAQHLQTLAFSATAPALVRATLQFAPLASVGPLLVMTPSVDVDVRLASSVSPTVVAAVGPHVDALKQCYRNVLTSSPTVAGTIIVRHTVGADGAVVDDAVLPTQKPDTSQILHVPLNACVRNALRQVRYDTAPSTDVTLPLSFLQPKAPTASVMNLAISRQLQALMRCHPTGKPTAPLAIAFTVDGTGAASDIVPPGNLNPECAVSAIAGADWPAPRNGTVRVSAKVDADGGLSRGEIQRVVSSTMSRIKYCYDVALKNDHDLHGMITLHYVIDGDGTVVDVQTLRPSKADAVELTNERVVNCIVDIIRKHRYPQPRGGGRVNVTYPFVFSSR